MRNLGFSIRAALAVFVRSVCIWSSLPHELLHHALLSFFVFNLVSIFFSPMQLLFILLVFSNHICTVNMFCLCLGNFKSVDPCFMFVLHRICDLDHVCDGSCLFFSPHLTFLL